MDFAKLKRLLNKIESPGLGRLDGLGDRAIARDNDYLGCGTRVLDVAHNLEAIHVRQYQIANDDLMSGLVEGFNCRGTSGGDIDGVTFLDEVLSDRVCHLGLVVDNKYPHVSIFHNSLLGL